MLELDKGIQQSSIPHGYRKKQVSNKFKWKNLQSSLKN